MKNLKRYVSIFISLFTFVVIITSGIEGYAAAPLIDRTHGAAQMAAAEVATGLRTKLLGVESDAVGPAILAEINANDPRCNFDQQVHLVSRHLIDRGHYLDDGVFHQCILCFSAP
ncbi:MAG: hypothetical protein LBI26_00480 [Holosporales bacterium]|jgi:hypothetical protein|nr:hypothetical protein [Holosporales bacterium]